MNYKKIIPACALIFAGLFIHAQEYSDNIKLSKSFRVNKSSTVEVYNKYGKLHILTWGRDSVKFDVDASIRSSSNDKVKKLRDKISFDFTGTEYYITAKTIFSNQYSGFFKDLVDFAEGILSSDNYVEINYKVYVPEYVNIKINNKFGDIYIESMSGDININLSNGDLKANDFNGNSTLRLSMGDADIKTVKNGKIYTNYSELTIDNSEQLTLDSKLSRININKVNILKVLSKKDKIYITKLNQIYGELYFSDFTAYNLENKLSFKSNYGNVNLELITKDFKFIDITSEYTDMNLLFEEGVTFDVDITDKDTYIKYPNDNTDIKKEAINVDENRFNTFGTIGKGTPTAKLKISAVKGNIQIYRK